MSRSRAQITRPQRLGFEPRLGAVGEDCPDFAGFFLGAIEQRVGGMALAGFRAGAEVPEDAFDIGFEFLGNIARGAFAFGADGPHDGPAPKSAGMRQQNLEQLAHHRMLDALRLRRRAGARGHVEGLICRHQYSLRHGNAAAPETSEHSD